MEPPRPRASVVVPTRGGARRLPRLMDLLAAQSEPSVEVVVVVDGDVDGSAEVLAGRRGSLDLRVEVLPVNRGRSVALNTGFDAARGDVLIRCDDDLEPAADFVQRHLAAHDRADVGVVGLYRNVYPDTAYASAYGRAADVAFRRQAYAADPSTWWRFWAGNVSVTRPTYDEVGPYDTRFRAYGWEDVDWGYRLHRTGRVVILDSGLETTHRLTATTTASRTVRAFSSGAAQGAFAAKHGEDVVPVADPGGVWGAAVRATAAALTQSRLDRASRAVDRGLASLPTPVARKAVALLVEAGHLAGRRIAGVDDAGAV
jgi:glycosyltransferase involved in cell wall biosynthesis